MSTEAKDYCWIDQHKSKNKPLANQNIMDNVDVNSKSHSDPLPTNNITKKNTKMESLKIEIMTEIVNVIKLIKTMILITVNYINPFAGEEMTKLRRIFNKVKTKSDVLNKKYPNFDGRAFWQPIKNMLADVSATGKWKKLSHKTVHKLMSIPEFTIDGYGEKKIIEQHHYLIQQVRIPTTEKCTARKIVQLALNIGQMYGNPSKITMKEVQYSKTGLNKLNAYVSEDDLKKISEFISQETYGNLMKYLDKQK